MWRFLTISHASMTVNENLANKPYFYLILLSNLAYLLIPVDARLVILGILHPFYPCQDGIPLDMLDNCVVKRTFGIFEVFQTLLVPECLITSETDAPSLTGIYFTCCTDFDDVIVFLVFSCATLGT